METLIDFAFGFSQGVVWPWPIAVYLGLAGMSGGAFIAAAMCRLVMGQKEISPLYKSASLISLVTILLGMVCLIFDLTKMLHFWKILIFYNPTSVMSIGVMGLLVFIPTMFLAALCAWADNKFVAPILNALSFLKPIVAFLTRWINVITWIGLIFGLVICAYTGFLISTLVRFPLINTAVLPALFVASGLSAGIAASSFGALLLGADHESHDVHALHISEYCVMVIEALCIFMIAFSLLVGSTVQQETVRAFVEGFWAWEFWIGVVGIGFVVPAFMSVCEKCFGVLAISALCSVVGMFCLRFFILYAGQLYGIGA